MLDQAIDFKNAITKDIDSELIKLKFMDRKVIYIP